MNIRWIDYEAYSCGFINGSDTSVCRLHRNTYKLYDDVTGRITKVRAASLQEAKQTAQKELNQHWSNVLHRLHRIEKVSTI